MLVCFIPLNPIKLVWINAAAKLVIAVTIFLFCFLLPTSIGIEDGDDSLVTLDAANGRIITPTRTRLI